MKRLSLIVIAVIAAPALFPTTLHAKRVGRATRFLNASAQRKSRKMPAPAPPPASAAPMPGASFGDKSGGGIGRVEVVWKRRKFRRGDRVRVTSWAGTIKPDESGHAAELNADAGRTGAILRGEKRQATTYFKPDPNEPIQILRIRWDKQTWTENGSGKSVTLDAFESTIHADYLKVTKIAKPR